MMKLYLRLRLILGEMCKSISGYPFVWWFATKCWYEGKGYGSQLLTYVEEAFLRDTLK